MTFHDFYVIRLFVISFFSAVFSFFLARFLIPFLVKIKFWKKRAREETLTGERAEVFFRLHSQREVSVPRGGGLIIWLSVTIIIFFFFLLSFLPSPWWLQKANFLSRSQTWLPLFALIVGSLVGLIDDILNVFLVDKKGGLSFRSRFFIVFLIGLVGGLWLYYKLGWSKINIPLIFNFPQGIVFDLGIFYIPLFILVMLACWAGGVIDGLDGLAGGVFASIFAAFSIISFFEGKLDLASFSAAIVGTLFSFLWFNIPPAKFYMGETGVLGLSATMATIAFLTDSVAVLPIIAFPMVLEVGTIIFQLLSKKIRKKKIWLSTPIHNHLEAIGWKSYQITMRFWVLSVICAILGVALKLMTLR